MQSMYLIIAAADLTRFLIFCYTDWDQGMVSMVCVQALQSFYLKVRSEGCTSVTGTSPYLHLLETLIRLAEARARADLRQVYWCHFLISD